MISKLQLGFYFTVLELQVSGSRFIVLDAVVKMKGGNRSLCFTGSFLYLRLPEPNRLHCSLQNVYWENHFNSSIFHYLFIVNISIQHTYQLNSLSKRAQKHVKCEWKSFEPPGLRVWPTSKAEKLRMWCLISREVKNWTITSESAQSCGLDLRLWHLT